MTRLADMRARLDAVTPGKWQQREIAWGKEFHIGGGLSFGRMVYAHDANFVAHAPEDMRALLDAWDFVLDGKSIGYVMAQLDLVAGDLELEGSGMAQTLSRLAVMLERLG